MGTQFKLAYNTLGDVGEGFLESKASALCRVIEDCNRNGFDIKYNAKVYPVTPHNRHGSVEVKITIRKGDPKKFGRNVQSLGYKIETL